MSDPLLALDGVSKAFPGRRGRRLAAVDRVSFSVRAGETVGVVGASGAGKSTIARLVAGLLRPDAGTIWFAGRHLVTLRARQRREVSRHLHLVFQDPYTSLAPAMRVADIVAEPLVIHRVGTRAERHEGVVEALTDVGLVPSEHYLTRHPHELSGGERQRVALARALVLRPQLLVADEPTAMLDIMTRAQLVALMTRLRADHAMAYLLVTHDLALADSFCDRLVVLRDGAAVEQGPAHEVLGSPRHPYTAALVEAARRLQPPARREGAR